MILLDFSGTMHSVIAVELRRADEQGATADPRLVRHLVLNSVRAVYQKFKDTHGELVIALDGRNYWRKRVFPYYKAARKKARESSGIDWSGIFTIEDKLKAELREYFPYRVVEVEGAEADDVIATLTAWASPVEPVVIVSRDEDFLQLLTDAFSAVKVTQWDPVRKDFKEVADRHQFLVEKIMKGDPGDGVPNVLSPDDVFVSGKRQTPLTQKRLAELKLGKLDTQTQRNFDRNQLLVDLSRTPPDIMDSVLDAFAKEAGKDRSKLFSYFIDRGLKNLLQRVDEF